MNIFRKMYQHITISSRDKGDIEVLGRKLKEQELKDVKIHSVQTASDDQWQVAISCKDAELVYGEEVLPLLYSHDSPDVFEVTLVFDDGSKAARFYPTEFLISFSLDSGESLGDKKEYAFVRELRRYITDNSQKTQAAVTYYIVGGKAVTMCIACAKPESLKGEIETKLINAHVHRFMINTIDRTTGEKIELREK